MQEKIVLIVLVLLGIAFHSIVKCRSLVSDAQKANLVFTYVDYLKKDILGIASSVIVGCVWFLLFQEVAAKYPALQDFIRTSFFCVGALGSYICQLLLSNAKTFISKEIDRKTDIADAKTTSPVE